MLSPSAIQTPQMATISQHQSTRETRSHIPAGDCRRRCRQMNAGVHLRPHHVPDPGNCAPKADDPPRNHAGEFD